MWSENTFKTTLLHFYFVANHTFSNIIDNNDFQSSTRTRDTHPTLYPIEDKFRSFGWEVQMCNGHSSKEISEKVLNRSNKKPFALVAKTIKGFPISFMKNNPIWHYRSPNKDEYSLALKEI